MVADTGTAGMPGVPETAGMPGAYGVPGYLHSARQRDVMQRGVAQPDAARRDAMQRDAAHRGAPHRPALRLVRDGVQAGGEARAEPAREPAPADGASVRTVPALSAREAEVLVEWFRSDSKATAAQNLYISAGTLNTHLARIRAKYVKARRPASTKAALVVRALQDGLISLDDW